MIIGQCNGIIGAIVGNDPAALARWTAWAGKAPDYVVMAFDNSSKDAFVSSIPWIIAQAQKMGVPVHWTIPAPGDLQLEEITYGTWDNTYISMFKQIVSSFPTGRIVLRFMQEQYSGWMVGSTAKDKTYTWNVKLWKGAFSRLSLLARYYIGSRAVIEICPNVTGNQFTVKNNSTLLPSMEHYDILGGDMYMKTSAGNKPGDFNWFQTSDGGLDDLYSLAKIHSKPFAISELGFDSDTFAADFANLKTWLVGKNIDHIGYWDRNDGAAATMISDGSKPSIGSVWKSLTN